MDKYVVINEAPVCFSETDVLICGAGPAGNGAAAAVSVQEGVLLRDVDVAKIPAEVGEYY